MHSLRERVYQYLISRWSDGQLTAIEDFEVLLGGYSKDTFKFDAIFERDGQSLRSPLILRRDTPPVTAILNNSRQREHTLLNRLREHTKVRVPRSYFAELDPAPFGRPAMIIERVLGCTADLAVQERRHRGRGREHRPPAVRTARGAAHHRPAAAQRRRSVQ